MDIYTKRFNAAIKFAKENNIEFKGYSHGFYDFYNPVTREWKYIDVNKFNTVEGDGMALTKKERPPSNLKPPIIKK